jgi:1-acyl-sn-glycerol-3-phosphate acyltransferase
VAHDAGYYWPRRGFRKRAGTIRVVIGPLIDSHGKTAEQVNREAEAWITRTMHELDRAHQRDR